MRSDSQDRSHSISMECIQGVLLSKLWEMVSVQDKSATIERERKDYICQMRQSSPSEDVSIGPVSGGLVVNRGQNSALLSEDLFHERMSSMSANLCSYVLRYRCHCMPMYIDPTTESGFPLMAISPFTTSW